METERRGSYFFVPIIGSQTFALSPYLKDSNVRKFEKPQTVTSENVFLKLTLTNGLPSLIPKCLLTQIVKVVCKCTQKR